MSAISLLFLEKAAEDNGFLDRSAKAYKGEIRVTSVADMVEKALDRLSGNRIRRLYVIGHGAAGDQSVGCGTAIDESGQRCIALRKDKYELRGPAESYLRVLRDFFAAQAVVTLGGCYVAKSTRGQALMRRLSEVFGDVAVEASESLQKPWPGMEGIILRYHKGKFQYVHRGREYTKEDTEQTEASYQ